MKKVKVMLTRDQAVALLLAASEKPEQRKLVSDRSWRRKLYRAKENIARAMGIAGRMP